MGEFTPEMLDAPLDAEGRTLAETLRECGPPPDRLAEVRRRPGEYHAYLELHLEQGAVLEHAGIPVGLVTGIAALTRFRASPSAPSPPLAWQICLTATSCRRMTSPLLDAR